MLALISTSRSILVGLGIFALSLSSSARLIAVSLSVEHVNGTLGSTVFADKTVVFNASGDTDQIYSVTGDPGVSAQAFNASIGVSIPSVGSATIPADQAYVFSGQFPFPGMSAVGVNVGDPTSGFGGAFGADPSLTDYAFQAPYGPAGVQGFVGLNPISTSAGPLTFSGPAGPAGVLSVADLSTATLTYGINNISASGALSSTTDSSLFSFVVEALGGPVPPDVTAVEIEFTTAPEEYVVSLVDPSGSTILAFNLNGPEIIAFNQNAIGGLGTYVVRVGATSQSSVGPFAFSIFGIADGGGRPPLLAGSGSVGGASGGVGIPTQTPFGLLLLVLSIGYVAATILRKSNGRLLNYRYR